LIFKAYTGERRHLPNSAKNPFVNMAYTFIEPLPVGLIITLVSAAVLRRDRKHKSAGCGTLRPPLTSTPYAHTMRIRGMR